MKHPGEIEFDKKLKIIFDEIDEFLEDKYGSLYTLHPARSKRGTTSNKEHDGLFNVGAKYSAGFGTTLGSGYAIDVQMSTLAHVPKEVKSKIEDDVIRLLREKLPQEIPDRELEVEKDGNIYKIYGDLHIGTV